VGRLRKRGGRCQRSGSTEPALLLVVKAIPEVAPSMCTCLVVVNTCSDYVLSSAEAPADHPLICASGLL
jgi:hypothetical protein